MAVAMIAMAVAMLVLSVVAIVIAASTSCAAVGLYNNYQYMADVKVVVDSSLNDGVTKVTTRR